MTALMTGGGFQIILFTVNLHPVLVSFVLTVLSLECGVQAVQGYHGIVVLQCLQHCHTYAWMIHVQCGHVYYTTEPTNTCTWA